MKITVLTLLSLFCFFFFSCSSENEQEVNRVNSQVENTESDDLELAAEEKPAKFDLTSVEGAFEAYLRLQSEFKKYFKLAHLNMPINCILNTEKNSNLLLKN